MKHSNNLQFSRKLRQFRSLSKKVNGLLVSGKFQTLAPGNRERLLQRLRHLYFLLAKPFSGARLRRSLAAASLLLGLGASSQAVAQAPVNFIGPVQNPYGLSGSSPYLNLPEAVDLDADGDLDLISGAEYGVVDYYENTGTATTPAFAAAQTLPFGLDTTGAYLAFPALADMDDDGDQDLFIGVLYGALEYYENVGDSANPAFAPVVVNPFGLDSANYFSVPELVDLDDDGDFDILVGEQYGNWSFFENTGTATAPAFAAPVQNPFGLTQVNYFGLATARDLDGDGDFDLLVGVYYGEFQYFENTGSATVPAFAAPVSNPFGLQNANYIGYPTLCDLDGDSDFDLLIGEDYGNFAYYKQDSVVVSTDPRMPVQSAMTLAPNPAVEQIELAVETGVFVGEAELSILNMRGKLMDRQSISSSGGWMRTHVKVDHLPAGVYIARLKVNEQVFRRKFVKQ